jgi:hypothetical protein
MKLFSFLVLSLVLGMTAFSAGCSTAGTEDSNTQAVTTTAPPPSNITYEKNGFAFNYPNNLVLTETDTSEANTARWESGEINLHGVSENTTINWMAMHHRPPDIPAVYEYMRSEFLKDPEVSDVKLSLLQTYPATTCGYTTLVGHVSFYDKVRKISLNEGIVLWYHPKQDRTYYIDVTSDKDYYSFVRGTLADYQQSFRCADS